MTPEDVLFYALKAHDIKQVEWALSTGADPRAHRERPTLLEHGAAMGFSAAVQRMHVRALSLAHQGAAALIKAGNPYGEVSPSNMVAAALGGAPDALLALAHTDAPFHVDQLHQVFYVMFDANHPDRWRQALPVLNAHFVGRLEKSHLVNCARSLIAARISSYPSEAWSDMLEMGWVDRQGLLKLSRHRPTMKLWANLLVISEDSRRVVPGHMAQRLEWLCQAGFDPKPLADAIERGPQQVALQQGQERSLLVPLLRALEQKGRLESATPAASSQRASASPRL